jgi:hypothetical protein
MKRADRSKSATGSGWPLTQDGEGDSRKGARAQASRNRGLIVRVHLRDDLLVVTNTNEAVTELNPAAASLL